MKLLSVFFSFQGTGLVTESKYGGGGGQPRKGLNGELITTRQSHFSKVAQGSKCPVPMQ